MIINEYISNRDTKDSSNEGKNNKNNNVPLVAVPGPTIIKEKSSNNSNFEIINKRGEMINKNIIK